MKVFKSTAFSIIVVAVLLACAAATAQEANYALKGTIVTSDKVIENGTILISGSKIQDLGTSISLPPNIQVIDTGGLILPGFIDLHNHLTWNLLPRWKPNKEFGNRYDWQQTLAYKMALVTPHAGVLRNNLGCDMNRYAEVKAIVQGETSVIGSLGPQKCIEGLARNLDYFSELDSKTLGAEHVRYEIFPLELEVSAADGIRKALDKQELKALIVHLAEGKPTDASAAREFNMLKAQGFLRPGVSIIHGCALQQPDFHEMAAAGVGLIWSPRSNLELYGGTTDVAAALREHVKIALAPDWSPSGSNGMLEELKFATVWNRSQAPAVFGSADLLRMATEYPAQLAGLSDKIGTLDSGHYADLLVVRNQAKDPYESLLHSSPADLELVIIGGAPVYGNPHMLRRLLGNEPLEKLTVCGAEKAIYFGSEARLQGTHPKPWKQTTDDLAKSLGEWGSELAPLADCAN
jgi:cytosine/adenosine deaminase-related metal-dependent hydrolase